MNFKELARQIVINGHQYEQRFDVEIDSDFAAYSLIKEIGQFADSVLVNRGKVKSERRVDDQTAKDKLAQELVDIVALAIINADVHDIDIEKGLIDKWVSRNA